MTDEMRNELRTLLDRFYGCHKDRKFEKKTYEDCLRKVNLRYFCDMYDIDKKNNNDRHLFKTLEAMEIFKMCL